MFFFFFFNDTATPEIFPFSLPDPLPIPGLPVKSSIFTGGGSVLEKASLRQPGAILLVSCYELGHQPIGIAPGCRAKRSEEHTSELQSRLHLVCRLLLEKKKR